MSQDQLWPAGPVAVPGGRGTGPSHKRAILPGKCDEPGCDKPRRRAQGARYCEDHARSTGYRGKTRNENAGREHITCARCGRDYRRNKQRYSDSPTSAAWRQFCNDCTRKSPLTLAAMRNHHVPEDKAYAWLMQGPDLRCEFPGCGRVLGHDGNQTARPQIDHDHDHCPHGPSCGECIRGVLCTRCNRNLGGLQALLNQTSMAAVLAYLTAHAAGGGGGGYARRPHPPGGYPPAMLALVPWRYSA